MSTAEPTNSLAASIRRARPSPTEWMSLLAGVYLTVHYAWLMDDAFVYFRYVDNLLFLKLGLVYNRGEYVEGFSSPLWTMLLVVGRMVQANYWLLVRAMAVLSFAGYWILLVAAHRRLSARGHINVPLVLTAFNYGVLTSFSSGLETPLVQLAAAAFAWNTLVPRSRGGQILVGLAPLARHELLLPWLISVGWAKYRTGAWPRWSLGMALVTLGAWTFFRVVYYADVVPNTFHLKNMVWVGQGLRYVWDTVFTYGLFVIVPAALGLAVALHRRGRSVPAVAERGVMVVMALVIVGYVVKIGGDFLHYRYLAFSFPLLLIPVSGVLEEALGHLSPRRLRWALPAVGVLLAVIASFTYPRGLDRHPYSLRARYDGDGVVEDAMAHRLRPELERRPWESGAEYEMIDSYRASAGDRYSFKRLIADYWCVRNYEHFDWYVLHSLGLTDPVLARIDVPNQRPGHRWNLHPLGQQIVQLRGKYGFGPGLYEKAIAGGDAPDWVVANRRALDIIDRRAYNEHDLLENLVLALRRPGRLELVSDPPEIPFVRGKRLGQ